MRCRFVWLRVMSGRVERRLGRVIAVLKYCSDSSAADGHNATPKLECHTVCTDCLGALDFPE